MKQEEQMQIPLLHYVTFVTSVINKDTKILSWESKKPTFLRPAFSDIPQQFSNKTKSINLKSTLPVTYKICSSVMKRIQWGPIKHHHRKL